MRTVLLGALFVVVGGAGGLLGSIAGAALGRLFVGGFVGGLLAAPVAAMLARKLGWIASSEVRGAAIGAALGFLAAATVAVNTLSSPIGPVASTLLVGLGGLIGIRLTRKPLAPP